MWIPNVYPWYITLINLFIYAKNILRDFYVPGTVLDTEQ